MHLNRDNLNAVRMNNCTTVDVVVTPQALLLAIEASGLTPAQYKAQGHPEYVWGRETIDTEAATRRLYPALASSAAPRVVVRGAGKSDPAYPPDTPSAISSIEELQLIGNDPAYPLNGNYHLTRNIDASATSGWNAGAGFEPIGTYADPFTGTFDGQKHTISGLTIDRDSEIHVGLFNANGATIKNVNLTSVAITGGVTGAILGYAESCIIECCYTSGIVLGVAYTGGIIGVSQACSILNCYSTCSVSGESTIGGLAGTMDAGTMTNCYSVGAVVASESVSGGLIGGGADFVVTSSYWDTQTSGQATSAGGTGKTTAEMKQQATFVGWNFTTIWAISPGEYPHLMPPLLLMGDVNGDGKIGGQDASLILKHYAGLIDCFPADPECTPTEGEYEDDK